jgi:hypothetical protein
VEQAIVTYEADPEGITRDQIVCEVLTTPIRIALLEPGDMITRFCNEVKIEDTGKDQVAFSIQSITNI